MARLTKSERNKQVYSVGCVTLSIIKYFALIMTVAYVGAFIASGIIFMVKGGDLTKTTLANLMGLITYYSKTEAGNVIQLIGIGKAKTALLLYAFSYSIKYGLMYVLITRFKEIFKSIMKNKMFTDKNIDLIYSSIGLSLIFAFAQPILMGITIIITHAYFDFASFDFSGILYVFVAVLLYMIFTSGYNIEKKHNSLDKELEEYRASISELEIEKLKKKKDEKETKTVEVKEEPSTTTKRRRRRRKKSSTAKNSSDKQ